jgi:PAS domain S-box-containing protein
VLARRAIEAGGQLIMKERPDEMVPGGQPFGDSARPSASIMYTPVRKGAEVIGVMSIQSYKPRAYDRRSLETLQALADHCGGALDRLRTEEALQGERHTAQRYLDIAGVMIVAIDPSQSVLLANRKTCEILACEESDLIGHNWFDFALPQRERDHRKAGFGDMMAGKIAPWEYVEGPVLTRRGEERLIAWHNTLLRDETGRVIATLSSGEDITERKGLEVQLRQSQKMEAVGQLAGGVAHDFNNMLAVIRGNAELLLMDEGQHTAETREGLKHVVEASERAANLTRQLLAFSRKQVLQSQPLVLNEVVANLSKMLHRVIGENINLQCHYAEPLPYVQADTGMMEQVILNLVVNARDAMPGGGQLRVATEQLTLNEAHARVNPEARAGEFVCLLVSDTGTGIAPEVLLRIFEPFFTTKDPGKGTGLGLATVYGIVKQHEGWIGVSSQVGEGSTFRVFLPAIPTPARLAAAAEAGAEVLGGTETILLVEDEHAVRLTTRRVLESKGYQIREATSAREALEVWQSHAGQIALLLTDIIMPGEMSGRDLSERLRGQRPGLKVILMSGYSAEVVGKNTDFFRRTRSHFLQKPCSSRALLETVRRCLDEKEPGAAAGEAGHAR